MSEDVTNEANGAGKTQETQRSAAGNSDAPPNTLTTRQGHPVADNQNLRTVGDRGPTALENYQFIKNITYIGTSVSGLAVGARSASRYRCL
jgi:catalase